MDGNKNRDNCSAPNIPEHTDADDYIGKGGKVWRPWKDQLRLATEQPWWGTGVAWGDRSESSTSAPFIDNYGPPAPGPKNLGLPSGW